MRIEQLKSDARAAKNVRLLKKLGPVGFRLFKSAYALLRHPVQKTKALKAISFCCRSAAASPEALPFCASEWKRKFSRLILTTGDDRAETLYKSFFLDDVRLLQCVGGELKAPDDSENPILLFAVKNDLIRVRALFDHYRKLGICRFAALDNGSSDGTLEYLLSQPDTDVFSTAARFGSVQKAGWLNRIAAAYGTNRWFLWADSDELLVWPGFESSSVRDLVLSLKKAGKNKLRTFMLDLYPKGTLLDQSRKDDDFLSDNRFFDPDSDDYTLTPELMRLSGGMRRRVFGLEDGTLSKISLLHFSGDRMLVGAHNVYPQQEDYSGDFSGVLLHYKFLPGDMEKYQRISAAGTYANGSAEYKRYLECFRTDPDLSAFCSSSRCYTGSSALDCFPFLQGK